MFMWTAMGEMDRGMASEATSAQHIRELAEGERQVGSVPAGRADALVEKEVACLRKRGADSLRLADAIERQWRLRLQHG